MSSRSSLPTSCAWPQEHSRVDAPLLSVERVSKSYGMTQALVDVSLSVREGEVVAVVGENGAGKSTLARIVAGATAPDSGGIVLDGLPISLHSPRDALLHGVSYIPQELAYLPNMTVAENVLVGRWPARLGLTSDRLTEREARLQMRRCGIDIDVSRPMSTLKLAECQLVEIVKAVTQSVRLVVLDEPTSSLSRPESQILFRVLQRLTRQGIGIVYISHRIDEVFQCGHRIDVLRNGELVASLSTSETSQSQVIAHMLGREGLALKSPRDRSGGSTTPVIRLVNWSSGGRPRLSGVDISVSRGEIVGLFGLRGCGAGAVAEGLIGLRPDVEGDFYFEGEKRDIFSSPREAREAKLIYLPPERKRDGLVMTLSVYANMTLSILDRLSRIGVIKGKAEKSFARRLVNRLNVRCKSIEQALTDLSGGNQQKVLLARCLAAQPSALVLREPTRGVDVGARAEVHEIVRDVSNQGTAILWVTSDAEEATTVSDRLLVMREGAVVAELSGSSMSQQSALGIAEAEVD